MKKFRLLSPFKFFSLGLLAAAGCLLPAPLTRAAGFSPGNLAVEYCPNNSSASTTFAILELSPNTAGQSAPVNSNSIPSTGASALRQSASAGTTGYLSTTADGTLLVFTAFEDATGVSDETTILPRGVATLDSSTNYTLQSSYTGTSGSQTRGATSLDNKTWLIADKGGVYTNGASAPVNVTNVIDAKAFGSTVYFLSQKSTTVISALSADATSLNLMTDLPADAATADFYLVSSGNNGTYDVLYYIDETSASAGTIFKYSLVGGTWTANGSYTTSFGGDGLCAALNGSGGTYLYVTTGKGGTSANKVIKLNDTAGYNATLAITTANNITL
ncbi:MAG TPA: hypothetical protein VG347_04720, partial [Verrucomicrobiae bacterium]|nr:hypothetical protein [Verrucomicrobiae bacterium]